MSPPEPGPLIGVINAGSSSVEFSFFDGEPAALAGQVDGIGTHPRTKATGADGEDIAPPALGSSAPQTPSEALSARLFQLIAQRSVPKASFRRHAPQHRDVFVNVVHDERIGLSRMSSV